VAAFGVDVELGGDFGVFELLVIDQRVFDVDWVVFGLDDESGRRVGGGIYFRVGGEGFLRQRQVAGVDDDGEVGTAA